MNYNQKYFSKKLFSLSFGRFFRSEGQRILMYHSLDSKIPDDINDIYSLNEELFSQQINYLHKNFGSKITPISKLSLDKDSVSITFDDGCKDVLFIAAPMLENLKIPFAVYVPPKLIQEENSLYLNKKELIELSNFSFCTIGAHGYSHTPLTKLNEIDLRYEIETSKLWLEDCLGKEVLHMSYPHGAVNDNVKKIVKENGFLSATSSYPGTNSLTQDKFELKRTAILSHDCINQFKSKLRGDWDWTRWMK